MSGQKIVIPANWISGYGVVMLLIGALSVMMPILASVTIEFVLGGLLIISGITLGASSFHSRALGGGLIRALEALLFIFLGLYLFKHPIAGAAIMSLVVASFFIIGGVFRIIAALQMRNTSGWIWILISGITGLLLGCYVYSIWPIQSAVFLGVIFGVNFIFAGMGLLGVGSALRNNAILHL